MRDYMDKRVTSPTWGPPPPCKQAQRKKKKLAYVNSIMIMELKLASAHLTLCTLFALKTLHKHCRQFPLGRL